MRPQTFVLALVWSALGVQPAFAQSEPAPPPDPESTPDPPPEPGLAEPPPPPPPLPRRSSTPAAAPAPTEVGPQSILPNLLATTAGTTIEVRVDYSDIDMIDATVLGVAAHVQHITAEGLGGYAALPIGLVYVDSEVEEDLQAAGNLEVGGLYVLRQAPTTDILFRGGLSLDTSTGDNDEQFALFASAIVPRVHDSFTGAGGDSTWGRAQAQLRHAQGTVRVGGSIGVDVPIGGAFADELDALLHVAVSAGLQSGPFAAALGLTLLKPIGEDPGDSEARNGLNLIGDYAIGPTARLFAAFATSFEDDFDGTSIGFGVRATK